MTRVPRCLVDDLAGERLRPGREARHHLGTVLRVRDGDLVEVLDGRGGRVLARWCAGGELAVVQRDLPQPPPADPVTLAVASPRPSRLDWLVEKATELGVATLVPLRTARAVREPGEQRSDRLRRKVDETLLQCGRLHRMHVAEPSSLADALAAAAGAELWLASPPAGRQAPLPPSRRGGPLLLLVGPEGGFSPDETRAALDAGAAEVCVGTTTLRVETAALALAVLAQVLRRDQPAPDQP